MCSQMLLCRDSINLSATIFFTIFFFNVKSVSLDPSDVRGIPNILNRERRQLLFPNSTLLQFNAGLATPIPLKDRSLSVNWAFQANFQLPWNRSQVPIDILLAGTGYTEDARKFPDVEYGDREEVKRELDNKIKNIYNDNVYKTKYKENVKINEKRYIRDAETIYEEFNYDIKNEKDDKMRYQDKVQLHHLYKYAEEMFTGYGYNGTCCVLRAICQLAAEPLHSDDNEDLLHELMQYFTNPLSDSPVEGVDKEDEAFQYVEAHKLGLSGQCCLQNYPECKISIVDLFSKVLYQ